MSSPAFTSLVDLCRVANSARVNGTDLAVVLTCSPEAASLITAIESGGWTNTVYVDGAETTKGIGDLPVGAEVKITIHGMTQTQHVVANNVGTMLRLSRGQFLGQPPSEYYLIEEDYASWELASNSGVLAYSRAIRVVNFIRRLADVVRDREDTAGEAIILATRKLSLPMTYDSSSLAGAASTEEMEALEAAVFNDHHADARRDIAKRVLVRFFDSVSELERFSELLKRIREVRQAFLADFDVYASGFSFDRAREEFERRKLDFVVKANTASSDVMNKLIAIPVGQGLLASQMKTEANLSIVNAALLAGSIVFALIALALIANQISVLRQVRAELKVEKDVLRERALPTYNRLSGMIRELESRLDLHIRWIPTALIALLAVTTTITLIAYCKLTSFG